MTLLKLTVKENRGSSSLDIDTVINANGNETHFQTYLFFSCITIYLAFQTSLYHYFGPYVGRERKVATSVN